MADSFITCSPGYERFLLRELKMIAPSSGENIGEGWISGNFSSQSERQWIANVNMLCFARCALETPVEVPVAGPRDFIQTICDYFCDSLHTKKIDNSWPVLFETVDHQSSPVKSDKMVEEFLLKLRKAVSRVAKLAAPTHSLTRGSHEGLFAFFVKDRAFVSTRCWSGGQRRMKMVAGAPSRSYLKIEEAVTIMGKFPGKGETVIDLGAAPGGWSFSASEHGAKVYAVDNGPLKDGAANNEAIVHLREDAFSFVPPQKSPVDWLLCDMVEDPDRVIALLEKWLERRWCKGFIVNLKFGHADPLSLISLLRDRSRGVASCCQEVIICHLYHDREELTVMGRTA